MKLNKYEAHYSGSASGHPVAVIYAPDDDEATRIARKHDPSPDFPVNKFEKGTLFKLKKIKTNVVLSPGVAYWRQEDHE